MVRPNGSRRWGNKIAHVKENGKQCRKIHFPCRIIFRKVSRENLLQKYSYASWKYLIRNPKMRNHENDHFLKSDLFRCRDIENEHFQKSHFFLWLGMMKNTLFSKVLIFDGAAENRKIKRMQSESRKVFSPQNT